MVVESRVTRNKQEVLEVFTLCSPLNRSINQPESISINNISRLRDTVGESMMGGLAAVMQNEGLSVDLDNFAEPSYIRESQDSEHDSPQRKWRQAKNAPAQKSMYFTYGEQLENHYNDR